MNFSVHIFHNFGESVTRISRADAGLCLTKLRRRNRFEVVAVAGNVTDRMLKQLFGTFRPRTIHDQA